MPQRSHATGRGGSIGQQTSCVGRGLNVRRWVWISDDCRCMRRNGEIARVKKNEGVGEHVRTEISPA